MHNQAIGELTRCFLYARKSTESDERQVQSIDDQIRVMKERALSFGITIVDVLMECKSAKEPHIRSQYYIMLDRIRRGEAQGIVSWKLDRLSRNPIDS